MRYIKKNAKDRRQTFNEMIQAHVFGLYEVWALGFTSHHSCQHARKFARAGIASLDCYGKLTGKGSHVAPKITS